VLPTTTMLIRRRAVAADAVALDAALFRLRRQDDALDAADARWLLSYVLRERGGGFGLLCLFQARDAAALQHHAQQAQLPADAVWPMPRTRIARGYAPTQVYLVRRPRLADDLPAAMQRLAQAQALADQTMSRELAWLHSHLVHEPDGSLGSACLIQAAGDGALRAHAAQSGLPADEILPVLGRVVFRDEPPPNPSPEQAVPA